jgi:hypothetical protein
MARIYEFEKYLHLYLSKINQTNCGTLPSVYLCISKIMINPNSINSVEQTAAKQILFDYFIFNSEISVDIILSKINVDRLIEWSYSHAIFKNRVIKWV